MYPGPNVPLSEIPKKKPYITWVFMGKLSPRIPREHNRSHGYTVRGTPNGPLREPFWNRLYVPGPMNSLY